MSGRCGAAGSTAAPSPVPTIRSVLPRSNASALPPGLRKVQKFTSVGKEPGRGAALGEIGHFSWLGLELFHSARVF